MVAKILDRNDSVLLKQGRRRQLERKKNVDQSQQTSRPGKCTLYLKKFHV